MKSSTSLCVMWLSPSKIEPVAAWIVESMNELHRSEQRFLVRRALAEPLRHPAPRVIYLRQKSVVVGQDFTPIELAAVPGGARLVWSSAKSPDGEDALVAQAACLAMAPSDRSGRGPEAGR